MRWCQERLYRESYDEYGKRESNRKFSKRSHSREISVSGFRCPRRLTLYLPNASPFTPAAPPAGRAESLLRVGSPEASTVENGSTEAASEQ